MSCFDNDPPAVRMFDYVGSWSLSGGTYPGIDTLTGKHKLILSGDSTFTATLSYFWTDDTSSLYNPIKGKWNVRSQAVDQGTYVTEMVFTPDSVQSTLYHVLLDSVGRVMNWDSDSWNQFKKVRWSLMK